MLSSMCRPVEHFHRAIALFDEGSAAFHPVAIIIIDNLANLSDLCAVDVAANDSINTEIGGRACNGFLELTNILDGVLDLLLQIRGQGPIGEIQATTDSATRRSSKQRSERGTNRTVSASS